MILLFFFVDFVSKLYISSAVGKGQVIPVVKGFFNIVNVHNEGIAFGMFAHLAGVERTVVLCVMSGAVFIVILFLIMFGKRRDFVFIMALSMIGGGALGNLYDRVFGGYVVDFLDFHIGHLHYPAFNLADTFITLGMFVLLLYVFGSRSGA